MHLYSEETEEVSPGNGTRMFRTNVPLEFNLLIIVVQIKGKEDELRSDFDVEERAICRR